MAREEVASLKKKLEVTQSRVETMSRDLEASQLGQRISQEAMEVLETEVEALKAQLSSRANSQEEFQAVFLQSEEFKDLLAAKAFPYPQHGFENCKDQFEKAGILPTDKEDSELRRGSHFLPGR